MAFTFASNKFVEDEVPDFKEAVASNVGDGTAIGAKLRTTVVVDFTACTSRTRLTGRPGDLFKRKTLDALCGQADRLRPVVEGNLVFFPDGHPQAVAVKAVTALILRSCQQFPRVADSAFLEVIAKGEVTVHLEERTVPRGLTNIVNIIRTNALLHRCCGRPRSRLCSQNVGNKRHHARDGEQNGRLRRDQRNRRRNMVAFGFEEVEPT